MTVSIPDSSSEQLVRRARVVGTDLTDLEIKAASRGLPSTTIESVSAFANGSGGTILLGISEDAGFMPAAGFDPKKIMDALAGTCADNLEPPIRDPLRIDDVDGGHVVRLDVTELDPVDKPCFVKTRGAYGGSFIRGGDGDRRLSHYEVTQLLSNRRQPLDDAQPVQAATLDDLSTELVEALLRRVRARDRRAFTDLGRDESLIRLGAATTVDDVIRPTLAGLLCLGEYPQQFSPQLFVSFVALPGLTMGEAMADGRRFLDNQSLNGPIPIMIEEALAAVERNMRRAVTIQRGRRIDHHDYPLDVIRELVVNAVMHRDYSPAALGTQIQVELYPDRLVVKSPGGLHGDVQVGALGTKDVSSSRNAVLAKLLGDVTMLGTNDPVCENRGSGLPNVMSALRDAGMSPPEFIVAPGHVHIVVPQHALLSPETIDWISSLPTRGLTDAQHLALAMIRANDSVTNEMLRVWGVNRQDATHALTDLVGRGLAIKSGGRRYATYRLAEATPETTLFDLERPLVPTTPSKASVEPDLAAVMEAIRAGHITTRAIEKNLGISYQRVVRRINRLLEQGLIEPTAAKQSRARSYRIVK